MCNYNNVLESIKNEYDVVKLLKESERGSVFSVRRKNDGKRFIFRIFEGKGSAYKELVGVSCRNLPRIFWAENNEKYTAVLEEYVFGDTLFEILKGGLLSEKEAKKLMIQLCNALSVLHEHGMVHRDIKPENIILRGDEAVLIDFDASRAVVQGKGNDTQILGTTGYASPEQYGISQTDARSDIYSLGVVLNVMLTGEHPSVKFAEGELGKIIQKCTMINPDSRYQSAKELEKAFNKDKKAIKILAVFAAVFALVSAVFGLSTVFEKPEVLPEEEKTVFEEPVAEEPLEDVPFEESEHLVIGNLGDAKGTSTLLPGDFYNYWKPEEIITKDIEVMFPGNLEKYISYEFNEDVLTFTVGNIPAEEWKKAYEENPGAGTIMASIIISAPNDDVAEFISHRGNGPTYSNLKMQYTDGVSLSFSDFDPHHDKDWTGMDFAKVIDAEESFLVAPIDRQSIFYTVFLWKETDGDLIWRILPYQFVPSEDCKAGFFESGKSLSKAEPIDAEKLWMDAFWEPITDPDRIVFQTTYNGRTDRETSFLIENGVELEIFERPGYINAKITKEASDNIELLSNVEYYILPPDAAERKYGETFSEWIDRVYDGTKFVGYKLTASGAKEYSGDEKAIKEKEIVDAGYFYDIRDKRTVSLCLLRMDYAESDEGTIWYVGESDYAPCMVIDWYTENPENNPKAEPEVCEYVYNWNEANVIIK